MATIAEIGQLINCNADALGTGRKGKNDAFKKTTSLWLFKKGTTLDASQDITTSSDYIQSLQIDKKLVIIKNVVEFTPNIEEDVRFTDESGVISTLRKGLYSFDAKFRDGVSFQSALASLRSFGAYDMCLVDNNNTILGTASGDTIKGFTLGMFEDGAYMFENNSENNSQSVTFQFIERDELSKNAFTLNGCDWDWSPMMLDGVNQVSLEILPIADAATTITVKARLKNGRDIASGIDFSQFLFTVGGATANPTAGGDSVTPGTYILTGFSALSTNDVVTARLYNNTTNKSVIKVDTELFQSNTDTAVVA